MQKIGSSDKINPIDITNIWIAEKGKKGSVIERQEYILHGVTHRVDGKHVVLRPTSQEREIAEALSRQYGKHVVLVPQIMFPQGIRTPDYLIDGKRFDLKSPTGNGKNLLYGLIAKKQRQAHNFIVDITKCPLSIDELERQTENLYRSSRVGFLEQVVFIKNGKIVKVFDRK